MSRVSGRNGRVYIGIASGGTAEPIPFLKHWTADQKVDKLDGTAWGDSNKTTFAGWPDAQGVIDGFIDDATQQVYTAAADGIARKAYFYLNTLTNSPYWFTTAIFDVSTDVDINGMGTISGTWAASSAFIRVG